MARAGKFLIVLLALFTARVSSASSTTDASYYVDEIAQWQLLPAVSQHKAENCPSHGMAMLILRYNETCKEYEPTVHNPGPVLQLINPVTSEKICPVAAQRYSTYFPEKLLRYEVYLYSLPLRSPPVYC